MGEQNTGLIKTIITLLGTLATYLWGGWTATLQTLVVLATFDYLSGVASAWVRKEVSSDIGRRGIAKKVGMFVVIAICNIIDQAVNSQPMLCAVATWWYIGNEAISVTENLGEIGVPIPERIKTALTALKTNKGG
jgi:toxin secretion/phage lysis holin